jgi:hypothetical protein
MAIDVGPTLGDRLDAPADMQPATITSSNAHSTVRTALKAGIASLLSHPQAFKTSPAATA